MSLRLLPLCLPVLLAACAVAPKPPQIREPIWPRMSRLTQARLYDRLQEAATAWEGLRHSAPGSDNHQRAEQTYEKALTDLLRSWSRRELPRNWEATSVFRGKTGAFALSVQAPPGHPREVSPQVLDRLRIAADVRAETNGPRALEEGLGVPVVGEVMHSPELAAKHPMMPLNGGHLTLTAVLEFDPPPADATTPRGCRLHLYNPLQQPQAVVAGRSAHLAADYTAAKSLALNDGFLKRFSLLGLLFPEKTIENSQLYRLELHDPKRIPVVFVHGLMSDPHIWYHCINAIYRDPVLRTRYQPWYFLYPTGLAVPATSQRLRESLQAARRQLDPEGDDPGLDRMVLVGHSMGGLLSRMQVISSNEDFYQAYFTRSPNDLNLSQAARARLQGNLHFQAQPYVKRLIFITVPHRGSEMADRGLVYRLSTLIRLPVDSMLLARELLAGNLDALSPQIRDWGAYAFLSLGTLSPKHPYLKALNAKPIPVPHHSIIGRVGRAPLEESSDRVVPYRSAHLDSGSELVVPYWHGCVEKPEVVDEVLRRLHQHLRENAPR